MYNTYESTYLYVEKKRHKFIYENLENEIKYRGDEYVKRIRYMW